MDSLAYGEPYGSSIVSQSTLKRTCSLSKFKGTNEISSSSSTASSSSFSSSSSEFVTVVEVDENLKKSRQQKFPFIECENNPSSMIMSTSITPSVKQTTDIGSTIEPFVTVLEVGNQNQNRQTNGRDTGNIINNNNIVITTNDNHLSTTLLEKNIVNRYLKTKTLVEQVTVYRLPGERLGMTLKFDGGANLDETIENLYIQNINPDSPASRISGSVLGRLCEGDEILDIAGEPVNTMTRKECVAALGDAPICFKMLVKRQETVSVAETTAPLQSTVDGTALTTTPQTGEVDYHKATLRRVDSENALTPPMRTRRQPPPVPPRNSTTSLTSGNSFRSPIKPPARKRPSQPPPLPPRRAKDTTGKSVTSNRPPSDLQTVSINGNSGSSGDTVIQTNTGYSGVSVDSHQIVSLVNSNGTSSVIVDCSHKGLEPDLGMTVKSMQTPKDNVKLPANNQLKINDVDFSDSQDLSFDSTTMGTPYLNGTSEMIIQGIKTTDTKNSRDKSSLFDKSRNIYDALLPAPPELYMDTVSPKVNLGIESDSDDTGSSVSTIIERFSFTGNSCPSSDSSSNGSINNSFRLPVTGSNNVTSVPSSSSPSPSSTVITSNTSGNLYNSSFSSSLNHDLGKVLDPFEKLRREFDEKGSLEELIAEAKSGFSLDNLIHEKNEPRSNRSSSTDTSTATTTINSNLLSANQSSFPCSILGPPTHQAPSPPIPSLPPLSPSRYEVNLDDYDDIQSISLTYEGNNSNSTPFCEPIVEPPKSFSNTFPIIREEGESSLEYDDVNGGQKTSSKVDENFIMSAADAAIAAADSVTLDAQEILSIVENMKLDEDLTLIPSIEEPVTVKQLNIEQQQSYSVHEEDEEETNLPKSPVNGHSPLSPSSSSASSSSSSTLPVTSDVSITDGEEDKTIPSLSSLSGSSERKAINSYELNPGESKSILSPDETYTDHHHRMNGDRNGHVSRHSSICSNSSNDSSPDPRSSPGRLTRCSKSSTRASTTGQSVNSLIPKMVELPNRITSRSAGILIPRPITSNTKPSNITTGLNSLPRSHHNNCNGYIGSLNNGTGLNGKVNLHEWVKQKWFNYQAIKKH
uniref:PDZ domain-containing protein n=1 Tax=Tetranychus urticae TaxID=32264 RepID=T1KJ85_TETUR